MIKSVDTVDCLIHLRRFPVKLDISMCSVAVIKNGAMFTIKSNLAVTARVSKNNVRAELFIRKSF